MVSSLAMASPLAALVALAHILTPTAATNANTQRHVQLHTRQATGEFPGTSEGCFSSPGGRMQNQGTNYVQSSLSCGDSCVTLGKPVMALHGSYCYCGDLLPALDAQLSESECNESCDGWPSEPCGGTDAYTVWLTGVDASVGRVGGSSKSSSSPTTSPTSTGPSHTPHPQPSHHHSHKAGGNSHSGGHHSGTPVSTTQKTVTKYNPSPTADSQPGSSSSSSPNSSVIGIAVGVIAGVLAFAGFVALVLVCLRRRRRMKNAEKGHRRADSLNAFVASGGRTPGTSTATSSFGPLAGKVPAINVDDTRLDPRIMHEDRRISGASFLADNEDYSRRILKVTNPDRG